MIHEVTTYMELLEALKKLTKEQLYQPVQIAIHTADCDKPVELMSSTALGTVGEFEFSGARSVYDNRYHAGDVVLLGDCNPFDEDGVAAWLLSEGDNGEVIETPEYLPGGPTPRSEQMAPEN